MERFEAPGCRRRWPSRHQEYRKKPCDWVAEKRPLEFDGGQVDHLQKNGTGRRWSPSSKRKRTRKRDPKDSNQGSPSPWVCPWNTQDPDGQGKGPCGGTVISHFWVARRRSLKRWAKTSLWFHIYGLTGVDSQKRDGDWHRGCIDASDPTMFPDSKTGGTISGGFGG